MVTISSCNNEENSVISNDGSYQFDSSRYEWTIFSKNSSFITFDSFSDSNIFILGAGTLTKFDGSNFTEYIFGSDGLYALTMGGFSNNSIYIGGDDNTLPKNGKPRLKKWNGSSFEEISISNPLNRQYQISSIFAISDDEIFMGTTRGDIIHYKNETFEFQRIDSTFIITYFGKDETGNYYCTAQRDRFDSLTTRNLDIYKKVNAVWNWTKVFSEQYVNDVNEIRPALMNKEFIGFKLNSIRKFTGSSFAEIFKVDPFYVFIINEMSDTTINTFLIPGKIYNDLSGDIKMFHWNGSKWSKELSFKESDIDGMTISRVKYVNGKYYFLVLDHFFDKSFLGIGIKKTQ